MKKILPALTFLMAVFNAPAQQEQPAGASSGYYTENYLRYDDYIYRDYIKTPLLCREGLELGLPEIRLGSGEKLLLSFDDLRAGEVKYQFTLIHCSADWKPSPLKPFEYLDGFYEDYINDYRFSFNTLQPYTHYECSFPNENIGLKRSGNHLVVVYPEGRPDQPLLSMRFYVADPKITVKGTVKRPGNDEYRDEKQQVLFSLNTLSFPIVDPYRNLTVHLRQNGRRDNMITGLQPLFVKGNVLDYQHVDGNIFTAGNEFRYFDIKTVKYPTERVERIEASDSLYHIWLVRDDRRHTRAYITEEDLNGQFVVRTADGRDPATEADYVWVHFTLPYFPLAADGNLFVTGSLTRWKLDREARMTYNFDRKAYEYKLLLKQGYYNYQYCFVENQATQGDPGRVEGNHFEARNDYTIYVYYRAPGDQYQQLIALERIGGGLSE